MKFNIRPTSHPAFPDSSDWNRKLCIVLTGHKFNNSLHNFHKAKHFWMFIFDVMINIREICSVLMNFFSSMTQWHDRVAQLVIAPARKACDPGSNPCPGEFFLLNYQHKT